MKYIKIFEKYSDLYTKKSFGDWVSTLNDNIYTFDERDLDTLRKVSDSYGYKMIIDDLHAIWDEDQDAYLLRDNNDMFFIPVFNNEINLNGEVFKIPGENYTISNFTVLFFKEEICEVGKIYQLANLKLTKSIWINKINDDEYFFVDVHLEATAEIFSGSSKVEHGLNCDSKVEHGFNCDSIDGLKRILDDETTPEVALGISHL